MAHFPECVARVPVSLWGSGGWGCVRSTLRLWPQPFATVRNRSYELRMAVPMGSSAEVVRFGGFQCVVASFRVAGVALRVIQTCFVTCWKSFCVAGAILLRRFQTMCGSFRGRHSTLDVSSWVFFCKSHWQGCVKWRQGANSVAGVAFCDMCWKLTEASHETSILRLQNLEAPTKTRRKTSILKLQSVKIGGGLARKARFDAPTSLVSSLWFPCGVAVSMGEAPHSTLYTLDSTLHTPHSSLENLHSSLCTLHFTLYTPHSITLRILHFTHSTLPTPHFTLHTPYFTLHIPHFILSTPHCRLVTGEICTRLFK